MGKKIFITVSEGMIARNILRSFVLEELLKEEGVEVGLLVAPAKAVFYEKEFSSPRVKVFILNPAASFLNKILEFLARNGFKSETVLTDQARQFLNDKKYFRFAGKRMLVYIFGRSKIFHYFLRWLAGQRTFNKETESLFLKEKPDLIFATDVFHGFDLEAMSAAGALNLKIIGMVRSWDNLAAGGLMQIIPEILLVWSPYLFKYALKFQYVPEAKIKMVGIPHYDWYAKKEVLLKRDVFLQKFGAAPDKKLILYAGIGNFLAPHEPEVMEIISKALAAGEIAGKPSVVFRPHPAFAIDRQKIASLPQVVFDDEVASYTGKDPDSWEMNQGAIVHLVNSLYHADLVIATASTIILDAAAFDKPIVGVAFDGYGREPACKSLANSYKNHTHSKDLSRLGGFKIVYNARELIDSINQYLESPKSDEGAREKIRQEFLWKLDGQSAKRVAKVLLDNL